MTEIDMKKINPSLISREDILIEYTKLHETVALIFERIRNDLNSLEKAIDDMYYDIESGIPSCDDDKNKCYRSLYKKFKAIINSINTQDLNDYIRSMKKAHDSHHAKILGQFTIFVNTIKKREEEGVEEEGNAKYISSLLIGRLIKFNEMLKHALLILTKEMKEYDHITKTALRLKNPLSVGKNIAETCLGEKINRTECVVVSIKELISHTFLNTEMQARDLEEISKKIYIAIKTEWLFTTQ